MTTSSTDLSREMLAQMRTRRGSRTVNGLDDMHMAGTKNKGTPTPGRPSVAKSGSGAPEVQAHDHVSIERWLVARGSWLVAREMGLRHDGCTSHLQALARHRHSRVQICKLMMKMIFVGLPSVSCLLSSSPRPVVKSVVTVVKSEQSELSKSRLPGLECKPLDPDLDLDQPSRRFPAGTPRLADSPTPKHQNTKHAPTKHIAGPKRRPSGPAARAS
ncbi:hypothetical protein E4U55_000919 [Claviceps digitariae]|nr:hypothetical protein E4U55_000919 [Claviceps digitariae]